MSERVEHAAAGRRAHRRCYFGRSHEGKEWLRHDRVGDVDWSTEFQRTVCGALAFLGHDEADAGQRRPLE